MRVLASKGHYCLYEHRGEGGVRDGFRCADCGRWSERAEDLAHAATCPAAPSLPPPPKPRWNALLGRRV